MKKYALLSLLVSSVVSAQTVHFNLKAEIFDDGQKITALELETHNLKIDRQKLDKSSFNVFVKGSLPIDPKENKVFGQIAGERAIKKAFINKNGNIELVFADLTNGNTLAYVGGDISRNVLQKLDYEVQLNTESVFPKNTTFQQNEGIQDAEAANFTAKTAHNGLNYQFFSPQNINKPRPLIVWLHGNGEGGVKEYQNNLSPILANRVGVAFTTPETQRIFGGAYVVVPQVPDTWYNNYKNGYLVQVKELIEEIATQNQIDRNRIYLFGASAGGYMATRMLIEYPQLFAAVSVSAPALDRAAAVSDIHTTEAELLSIKDKPFWLVHSVNDPTIAYTKTSKRVFQALRDYGAILTVYPEVKIGRTEYNGHWSWIYSLRNMPKNPQGESLFEWAAKQRLNQE
ncbi:prolyl oligopeptidase family serine peptidase [Mannheimia granulomatis]|uniref:prolyl oligopeptidase family serine peptidase n=1 Tax=Mannheimia granulomatis TaxID=85402 RepID=UPI00047D5673|nr:PHB depolymerase family esterase [Mannheimia granulomatis]QLB19865.1 phospholipase [Mannheimia granulomatis]